MRTTPILAILFVSASLAAAQDRLAGLLRQGIVEEESNQNLDKAIQAYKSIVTQYDEERKIAATALFRLAECYGKQGAKDQAISAYMRLNREFPDQAKLADLARSQLSKTYGISPSQTSAPDQSKVAQADRMYKALLEDEIKIVEDRIAYEERQIQMGTASPMGETLIRLRRDLIQLKRRLVPYESGLVQTAPDSPRR